MVVLAGVPPQETTNLKTLGPDRAGFPLTDRARSCSSRRSHELVVGNALDLERAVGARGEAVGELEGRGAEGFGEGRELRLEGGGGELFVREHDGGDGAA